MIPNGRIQIGDVILYQRGKKIHEWEINKISPSGDYFEIENDDWNARWVHRNKILEIMQSGLSEIEIISERPPVIESKFK